jgi:hypothetical protein
MRLALPGVASIAALLITTGAMVAERPENAAPAMSGGMGGSVGFLIRSQANWSTIPSLNSINKFAERLLGGALLTLRRSR